MYTSLIFCCILNQYLKSIYSKFHGFCCMKLLCHNLKRCFNFNGSSINKTNFIKWGLSCQRVKMLACPGALSYSSVMSNCHSSLFIISTSILSSSIFGKLTNIYCSHFHATYTIPLKSKKALLYGSYKYGRESLMALRSKNSDINLHDIIQYDIDDYRESLVVKTLALLIHLSSLPTLADEKRQQEVA